MPVAVAEQVGIDAVHFGIVMVLTLTLGLLTPPVGIVMYIVCSIFDTSIPAYVRQSAYLFLALLAVIVLTILVPDIALWLPDLIY